MDPAGKTEEFTWEIPRKFGYGEAVQAAGTVVAPLLAGFSITLTVLVVDRADAFWCADLALALLVAAASVLLGAIQCAYTARQFLVTPDEIETWLPELGPTDHPKYELAWERARQDQRAHFALHSTWARRFRIAYFCGVLLVLLALIAILIPPGRIEWSRWVVIGFGAVAALAEAAWIAALILADDDKPKTGLLARVVRRVVPPYTQPNVAGRPHPRPQDGPNGCPTKASDST